jgi:hypothetical protein
MQETIGSLTAVTAQVFFNTCGIILLFSVGAIINGYCETYAKMHCGCFFRMKDLKIRLMVQTLLTIKGDLKKVIMWDVKVLLIILIGTLLTTLSFFTRIIVKNWGVIELESYFGRFVYVLITILIMKYYILPSWRTQDEVKEND